MGVTVKFRSKIPTVLSMADMRTQAAIAATAELIEGYALFNAPEDTGDLRDSIEVIPGRKRASGLKPYHVGVGSKSKLGDYSSDPYYAHFIEFGTSRHAARPFLTPAAEDAKGEFVALMKQIL